jgi:hypothetical protein
LARYGGRRFPILAQAGILAAMPPDDFTDAERAALIAELKQIIAADPFPLSPRIRMLRAILEKLEATPARPQPYPAPKPAGTPSLLLTRKKGRRR